MARQRNWRIERDDDGNDGEGKGSDGQGGDRWACRADPTHDAHRTWFDRAGDEVRSWFGDDRAELRRRTDRWDDAYEGRCRVWQDDLAFFGNRR